jgi:hypothetical protein
MQISPKLASALDRKIVSGKMHIVMYINIHVYIDACTVRNNGEII